MEFFESCLLGLVLCELCVSVCVYGGSLVQFLGETEVWELEVGLGWGTLVCVLAGSLLCVNGAELKASFTERGSVKGMCRMLLGSSNGNKYEGDKDGKIFRDKKKSKVMENCKKYESTMRRWARQKLRQARTEWRFTVVKIEAEWRWRD